MTDAQDDDELMSRAADGVGVPVEVLTSLLALEDTFQNFSVFGAKADFSRQVTAILDDAANKVAK